MLDHVRELILKLDELGIKPSLNDADGDEDEEGEWEDASSEDDVDMTS
jgi:hypothetical protein